jgi:hypothetical protein
MKTKRSNLFTRALNSARDVINTASGVFQELTLPDGGETTLRYRLSPYGEFPVTDVQGRDIVQVIDRTVGETLAANFGSLRGKFATFFRGIPIYEGHADDPDWLQRNPGHRASAVGRIKSIEPEEDGIYVTASLNSEGISLLGGDAPKYTGHSPHWRLSEIPGKSGKYRPILLWSDALTNMPNIMQNAVALNSLAGMTEPSPDAGADSGEPEKPENTEDMKLTPDALKALGFAPDAEPTTEAINAAILKLIGEKTEAEAKMATSAGETTAANSRAALMETELNLVRGTAVDVVLTEAINSGRITEADKPAWTNALNASFATESAKLSALMPTINTANRLDGKLDRERGQLAPTTTDAINDAVRAIAKDNQLDLGKTADYDRAWKMLRVAKPELFEKA